MRADRLVRIMVLLQNNGRMTTRELSRTLEVSHRTILRDMDALSLSGIPVVADRGKTGGWRLMDHFRSQLSGLKLDEMKTLFILPSESMLEDLGVRTFGTDTRQKLLAALPSATKSEARHFLEKIYIDTGTWKPVADKNKALTIIQEALWADRKLKLVYQKADGTSSSITVCPLGLVVKGSVWYLVALNEQEAYRNYRLSRIVQAEPAGEGFTRPKDFHLAEYWKRSKLAFSESLPAFQVKVAAAPEVVSRMTFTDKFVVKVAEQARPDDGMLDITLNFNTEQEAVQYVLGFGGAVKLIEPERLIALLVQQAHAVIGMYPS
ncbi:helix-turn-helix transcriptional regulator [Paenibacillus whitsoniae]|uniref:YafY family transcriptional regulator n=1 Tax=Paenibacillus whitsoniae TaxID=2496558 RepID=A0A3S0CVY7_9BACL|nr:YafY family protein [Paenibacillus whitsoniae]RTE10014.1 YafY family transcriptional regulator [Paenibacillus whitsoniae]